ncbi:MAG: ABC transporter permease [Rhodospirillaceae bacterium]|nr:ABC transporter permease [Rhodospirillaceae bacterium]
MTTSTRPQTAIDRAPGNWRPAFSRLLANRDLRLFLLVLPLLAFVVVTVVVPVAQFLYRAVDNDLLAENLPLTAASLASWAPDQGVPGEASFRALAHDIHNAREAGTLGQVAQALNQQITGVRNSFIKAALLVDEPDGVTPEELMQAIPALGETPLWALLQSAGSRWTDFYLLQSIDLERNAGGEIINVSADRAIFREIIWRTVVISVNVTLICILLSLPVAHVLANARAPWSNLLLALVLFPLWTSLLVRTVSWIIILQGEGPVNATLLFLGIVDEPLRLVYTRGSLYIAMVQVLLPLMILSILSVLLKLPKELLRAATSLGANWWQGYWRVLLPLLSPGILTGSAIVFVFALGYYITPTLIGGPRDQMLSSYVAQFTNKTLNWGLAGALAVQLMALLLIAGLGWAAFRKLQGARR